MLFLNLD